MKAIIKRALPLDVRYTVIDKKYISLVDGFGCTCDNCGKLIANIAIVKSVNGVYNIGFDCLETFLMNNNLLDGFTSENLDNVRHNIKTSLRFAKHVREVMDMNSANPITGIKFTGLQYGTWVEFYWLTNGTTDSRNNSNFKVKNIDYNFFIDTVRNIFLKLDIIEA